MLCYAFCFSDNYMYIVWNKKTNEAAVVDPFDAKKIYSVASARGLAITTIITTHRY